MVKNIPLLRALYEHITTHPEQHNQGAWKKTHTDGTVTMCSGGRAIELAGGYEWSSSTGQLGAQHVYEVGGTEPLFPDRVAYELLGLSDDESGDLFYLATNRQAVDMIAEWLREADEAALKHAAVQLVPA